MSRRTRSGSLPRRSLSLLLALRYLRSTRRDAFISFLSAAAAGGLALGTAVLVLALAALGGFQQALREEVLARTPEIEVELPAGADAASVRQQVAAVPGVRSARLRATGPGWLAAGGRVRAVLLVGFDGERPPGFPPPAAGPVGDGVWVPERLAEVWGLRPGDPVELISGRPTLSPLGLQPRVRRLEVAAVYPAGRTELEDRVAVPLAGAEALLGAAAPRLVVSTGDLDRAPAVASNLAGALPAGAVVRTWRDLNRGLFFALRLEKSLMFLAVFLIVVVAALALVSDLHLLIAAKRPEVGMLGAMGARPAALRRAFLWLGSLIAVGGVVAGTAVGVTAAWILDRSRALRLPEEVYFLDYVPFRVLPGDLLAVTGASLGLAAACAWWAARRAAALRPVEALRR